MLDIQQYFCYYINILIKEFLYLNSFFLPSRTVFKISVQYAVALSQKIVEVSKIANFDKLFSKTEILEIPETRRVSMSGFGFGYGPRVPGFSGFGYPELHTLVTIQGISMKLGEVFSPGV